MNESPPGAGAGGSLTGEAPAELPYRRRQVGKIFIGLMVAAIVGITAAFRFGAQAGGGGAAVVGGIPLFLVLVLFVFHSLLVEVTEERIRVAFGPGWIRWRFRAADVAEARKVRNHWYYGWGIRLTPHGWLYNVAGLDAVQIRLKGGRTFRVGTDDPDGLLAAIRTAAGLMG